MGGGDRKKFNKSRSSRKSQSSPSVESWMIGRNFSGEDCKGKSDASRSRRGKGKHGYCSASGSGYGSTSGGDRVKSRGNAIGYVSSCFNSQDNSFPNVDPEKMNDLESQPMILLDSKETPIVAYVDKGPNKNMPSTEYAYDYTAGFTLDKENSDYSETEDSSDDESGSTDSLDKTVEKLGGIALQEASKEYGMKKKLKPARKSHRVDYKATPGKYGMVSAMDEFILKKDPRPVYGRKKHTKRTLQS